jgi:hypothetical protein
MPASPSASGGRVRANRKVVAVAVAVIAAALVGGIAAKIAGDERLSKAEYEQKVRSVYAAVQQAFRETNVGATADLAPKVEDAQAELRKAADELEQIKPPNAIVAENHEIVVGMREYAGDLDQLRLAAENGDGQAVEAFNAKIGENRAIKQIAEAAEELKFKGYNLGPIAEE